MPATSMPQPQDEIATSIKPVFLLVVSASFVIWINILVSDEALLTTRHRAPIPGTGIDAHYPIFLLASALLLAIFHTYLQTLVQAWTAHTWNAARLTGLARMFYLNSRTSRTGFVILLFGLGPTTLIAATWKAMALPALGIPIGILALLTAFWTIWLLIRRFLELREIEHRFAAWSIVFTFVVFTTVFLLFNSWFIRPLALFRADLSGTYLAGLYLKRADLRYANFRGATLADLHFDEADLRGANLSETKVDNLIITDSRLDDANFENSQIIQSIIWRTTAEGADFTDSKIISSRFSGTKLDNSLFSSANLRCVSFQGDEVDFNKIITAHPTCAEFRCNSRGLLKNIKIDEPEDCEVPRMKGFVDSTLGKSAPYKGFTSATNAKFRNANIEYMFSSGTSFGGTDFTLAQVSRSYIEDSSFQHAQLIGAALVLNRIAKTDLGNADLSGSLISASFLADVNMKEINVSGLSIRSSRLIYGRLENAKATPLEPQAVEERLERDNTTVRAGHRLRARSAMISASNPFGSSGDPNTVCELGVGKRENPCTQHADGMRELTARRLSQLACNDSSVVPDWRSRLSQGGHSLSDDVRQAFLKQTVDIIAGRDIEEFFDEATGAGKESPQWAVELAKQLLSDHCERPDPGLSPEDNELLRKISQERT